MRLKISVIQSSLPVLRRALLLSATLHRAVHSLTGISHNQITINAKL